MKHTLSTLLAGIILIAAVIIVWVITGDTDEKAQRLEAEYDGILFTEGVNLQAPSTKKQEKTVQALLKSVESFTSFTSLNIDLPYDKSVFPPDIIAPTFLWYDESPTADTWLVRVDFDNMSSSINYVTVSRPLPPPTIDPDCVSENNELPLQNEAKNWTPDAAVWDEMKLHSTVNMATVNIYGFNRKSPNKILSKGQITFQTSKDPVSAPIFYRDVPLMPVKLDISNLNSFNNREIQPLAGASLPLIAWRLRDISLPESRLVLKDLPTCTNCHSFSSDGTVLGMDIDGPQKDKGAYGIAQVSKHMTIERDDIISWNYSFKDKPREKKTIGFLSRISPDGQYVISTVNESVYVENFLDYKFLQVFFPTRGVLAYYSVKTGEMKTLPGADDPRYVHCDPVWSPDGKTIIFARAGARNPDYSGQAVKKNANDNNEMMIQYDLFRMPFNDGKGGKALPVQGASNNGMSNTFPKVSPDGKFIVYVQCRNGQLIRPDSRLWILPFEGGRAREMTCNTELMNSWHSFSPNCRWMVFSSKARSYYTQMFLTHIDEDGNDSPPVLIQNSTADNRAVNLPEFANISYNDLESIQIPAISHIRNFLQSDALVMEGRHDVAIKLLLKAIDDEKVDKKFRAMAYSNLGIIHFSSGKDPDKAIEYLTKSIENDPEFAHVHFLLGSIQERLGNTSIALESHEKAYQLDPYHIWAMNRLARSYLLSQDPEMRDISKALEFAEKACALSDYREPALLEILGGVYSELGRMDEAVKMADLALKSTEKSGRSKHVIRMEQEIALYRQGKSIKFLEMPIP